MAFDTKLADRIRAVLGTLPGLTDKKMFGGIGFLVNGNICCGVHRNEMIVRLDPADTDEALLHPHTRPFDITGRPMKGWILVGQAALESKAQLGKWVRRGVAYAGSLPAK